MFDVKARIHWVVLCLAILLAPTARMNLDR